MAGLVPAMTTEAPFTQEESFAQPPHPSRRPSKKPPKAKASRAGAVLAFCETGRAVWTPRDYAALAREGFQKNAIVHRAVRLVSEAAASLPLTLLEQGRALDAHRCSRC